MSAFKFETERRGLEVTAGKLEGAENEQNNLRKNQ